MYKIPCDRHDKHFPSMSIILIGVKIFKIEMGKSYRRRCNRKRKETYRFWYYYLFYLETDIYQLLEASDSNWQYLELPYEEPDRNFDLRCLVGQLNIHSVIIPTMYLFEYIHKSCSLKYFPLSKFLDNDYVLFSAFLFFFFWFSSEDGFHFNTISDYIEAYRLCHIFLQFFSEAIVQNQQ